MTEVRSATLDDAAEIAHLLNQLVSPEVEAVEIGERLLRLAATGADPVFLACEGGLAIGLIAHAERKAAADCEIIELTSVLENKEAHAFYRSVGFEANSLRFRKSLSG
jgi:hypothetical protein